MLVTLVAAETLYAERNLKRCWSQENRSDDNYEQFM